MARSKAPKASASAKRPLAPTMSEVPKPNLQAEEASEDLPPPRKEFSSVPVAEDLAPAVEAEAQGPPISVHGFQGSPADLLKQARAPMQTLPLMGGPPAGDTAARTKLPVGPSVTRKLQTTPRTSPTPGPTKPPTPYAPPARPAKPAPKVLPVPPQPSVDEGEPRPSLISLTSEVEPTLLVVGEGFEGRDELIAALQDIGAYVEPATTSDAQQAAVTVAPDLVVLLGDAASDRLADTLEALGTSPMSSVVPVAVLSEDDELAARLSAFRHGAAAAVSFEDGALETAAELLRLAKHIPERSGASEGKLGEATLPELITALSEEVRSGILSVYGPADPGTVLRLALGGGKPLAAAVDDFVSKVNELVLDTEPVQFEFDERAGGTVSVLSDRPPPPRAPSLPGTEVAGLRILIAGQDPAAADAMAQKLRVMGGEVQLTDFEPDEARLDRLRHFDPMVVLIGEEDLSGPGYDLVRRVRLDYRLRWAALLVIRWSEVWPDETQPADLDDLVGSIAALAEPEFSAKQRLSSGAAFDVRLESIGGARLLRALADADGVRELELTNPRIKITVLLDSGQLVACQGVTGPDSGQVLDGPMALAALLVLRSGRVRVSPSQVPPGTPRMGHIGEVLDHLDSEPPITPSLFPGPPSAALPEHLRRPASDGPAVVDAALASAADEPLADAMATPRQRRVTIAGISMPYWGVALLALLGLVGIIAVIALAVGPSDTPEVASGEKPVDAPPTSSSAVAYLPAPTGSALLLERARLGDEEALKKLEELPPEKRSTEQALALSQGWLAKKRIELDELDAKLEQDPALLEKRATQRQLLTFSRDASVAQVTLRMISKQDSPIAADLLYEVWTGTRGRTEGTRLAQALVYSAEVRPRASPALSALLDLRKEKDCEKMREVLARVREHGDRRSLRGLAKLTLRRGCGPKKRKDCFPCLRDGEELRKAINTVKDRPDPRF